MPNDYLYGGPASEGVRDAMMERRRGCDGFDAELFDDADEPYPVVVYFRDTGGPVRAATWESPSEGGPEIEIVSVARADGEEVEVTDAQIASFVDSIVADMMKEAWREGRR